MRESRAERLTRLGEVVELLGTPHASERRRLLAPLLTLPDPYVYVGTKARPRGAARSAMASSYVDVVSLLLDRINSALGSDLRVSLGGDTLLEYCPSRDREPMMFAAARLANDEAEIEAVSHGVRRVPNKAQRRHVARGRGLLRTPWGTLLVEGERPERPTERRVESRIAALVADALLSGDFARLRICRAEKCENVFIAGVDRRTAFCSRTCENRQGSRVRGQSFRAKRREEKVGEGRAKVSDLKDKPSSKWSEHEWRRVSSVYRTTPKRRHF